VTDPLLRDGSPRHDLLIAANYAAISVVTALYVAAAPVGRQDRWILDGLELPFYAYLFLFFLAMWYVKSPRYAVVVATAFLLVATALPNLKYQYFYGIGDENLHYEAASVLASTGIPLSATPYTDLPGFHIWIVELAEVAGVPVDWAFRFAIPLAIASIPGIVYATTSPTRSSFERKVAIIMATIPFFAIYRTNPALFSTSLVALLILASLSRYQGRGQSGWTLVAVLSFSTLTVSHALTSLVALAVVLSTAIGRAVQAPLSETNSGSARPRNSTSALVLLLTIIMASWWILQADFLVEYAVSRILEVIAGQEPKAVIPSRFFDLPVLPRLVVLLVARGGFVTFAIFMVCALAMFTRLRPAHRKLALHFLLPALPFFIIIGAQLASNFGSLEIERFFGYAVYPSSLFMATILALTLRTSRQRAAAMACLLIGASVSTLSVYPAQPLVPTAEGLVPQGVRSDVPLVYFHQVTTTFQVSLIQFASTYLPNRCIIGTDTVTAKQIQAFAGGDLCLSSDSLYGLDAQLSDVWLFHFGGVAGPISETPDFGSEARILEYLSENDLIYSNGYSFLGSRRW